MTFKDSVDKSEHYIELARGTTFSDVADRCIEIAKVYSTLALAIATNDASLREGNRENTKNHSL